MRFIFFFFVLFVSIIAAEIALDGNVLVLDDDNWEEATGEHSAMLVEFYAPWCGHCKTLAPEWTKAAKSLASSDIKLAKVDATVATKLAKRFEVKGFPTIKFFKHGQGSDYNGGRTESEIVSWVNKKSGPAAKTVTAGDLASFRKIADGNVAVLGVFASRDSAHAKQFLEVAAASEDIVFGISTDEHVRAELELAEDTVVMFKTFDGVDRVDHAIGEGEFDTAAVKKFVDSESVPLVSEFSQESSKKIFKSPIQKHALFFTKKGESHHENTVATASSLAVAFRGQFLFVNVPHNDGTSKVFEYFGLKTSDLPTLVLADMSGGQMKKYPYSGEMSVEAVSAFFEEAQSGKIKVTLKSEEVTAADTAGDVKVVKGNSFADIVLNNDKDVFIEFYAPWCGHCKTLAPTWDALGAKFHGNPNVVIAKMDATANEIDVTGMEVKGFPSLFFIKGSDKTNPVKYEGGRELSNLVDYMVENGSHKHDVDNDEL